MEMSVWDHIITARGHLEAFCLHLPISYNKQGTETQTLKTVRKANKPMEVWGEKKIGDRSISDDGNNGRSCGTEYERTRLGSIDKPIETIQTDNKIKNYT